MLNGVDLAAREALAEQIREDSWEAQLSIGVQARPGPGGRCRVDTEPMRLGSSRVARSFTLHQGQDTGNGSKPAPSGAGECLDPVGSVLVGLGACVADNVVARLTAEGCHLTFLEVVPAVEPADAGDGTRLSYGVRIEGEVSAEQARRAVLAAGERGSGHRTLEDPNEIRVVVQTEQDVHLTARPAAPRATTARRRAARVAWEVGAHVIAEVDGVRAESDQPKQLFGADIAPSAQEYFLSALAGEALRFAAGADGAGPPPAADDAGGPGPQDAVHASGRIDLRGPYSTQDAPAGLRNILVQLLPADPSAKDDDGGPAEAVRGWLAEGEALRLIRDAHPIRVDVVLNGTPIATGPEGAVAATAPHDTKEQHSAP
ncbi:OsmC family protein [Streptomyces sp. NBC_00083]|uniref:OsmC family protein n=1 Tax=Streptomyces sp. NBC_00083 TaxID=2975647 RepID=UPI00225749CD|nr:hypothetical protein [Streptomyces sp. NBC_00083]MCX5383347.1 hypothetical protein [Streptomyces sp. NBC_00083]